MKLRTLPVGLSVAVLSTALVLSAKAQPHGKPDRPPPGAGQHPPGKEPPGPPPAGDRNAPPKHRNQDEGRSPRSPRDGEAKPEPPGRHDHDRRPPPPEAVRNEREKMRTTRQDRRLRERSELRRRWGRPMMERRVVRQELAVV